jgi:MYXO-CTERM domain-containing protein
MRTCAFGVAVALSAASVASADIVLDFGDFSLNAEEFTAPIVVNVAAGDLTGVSIEMDYDEPVEDFSWASDLELQATAPDLTTYYIGGLTDPEDYVWPFDGSVSNDPGFYSGTVNFDAAIAGPGEWTLVLFNDWASDPNPNDYSNVIVTLHGVTEVPAPGALALLGLAGLVRRRRR